MNPANEYQVASNHHDVGTELPETQRRDVVTSRWEPLSARLRLLVLTVLTVLAALLLPALHASASGLPAPETRVGAISPTVSTVVGVAEHIAAGQHLGRAPSQLRLVSGHCVAAEETTVAGRSLNELSQQGAQADRNGLTQAGRALQKHANRAGNSAYPKVPGGELNGAGQDVLDEILTNPMTAERSYVSPNYGPVREFLLPDMGARFEEFGRLIGFL